MPRARRPCSEPGCPEVAGPHGRCATHQRERERYERATVPTKRTRTTRERNRRAAAVSAHRRHHGDVCPGYDRPPHTATDLTADHVHAVADGGSPTGALTVLCRACNSRKNAQVRRSTTRPERG